jgi:hypothetical protein
MGRSYPTPARRNRLTRVIAGPIDATRRTDARAGKEQTMVTETPGDRPEEMPEGDRPQEMPGNEPQPMPEGERPPELPEDEDDALEREREPLSPEIGQPTATPDGADG